MRLVEGRLMPRALTTKEARVYWVYSVRHSNNAMWSQGEFTSRRAAELFISRKKQSCIFTGSFTIHKERRKNAS